MKGLFLAILMLSAAGLKAEDFDRPDLRFQEGTLFSVSLNPKSRELKVSFAGKPVVEASPDRFIVLANEIGKNGKIKKLTVKPSGDSFQIMDLTDTAQSVEVKVQDRSTKHKKESLKIELQ